MPRCSVNPRDLAEFNRLRRRLAISVVALVCVTVVGVVGFAVIGSSEHGLLDALYMTIITLTTVGFAEIIDMSNSPGGRAFTLALLLVGFAIVLYAVPMMTAFVIEGQLLNVFERRRMEKSIAAMSDHYVVTAGAAEAGHVVEELVKTGRRVVLVSPEGTRPPETGSAVPVVTGDPTDDSALTDAGIERAAGFVACMESEKDNILAVLTARRLAPKLRIVAATERAETEGKLLTAGVDAVVSPNRIGGLRMASEMVRPKVVSFLDNMLRDEKGGLRVEEVTVQPETSVVGESLESRLEPGMTLIVMTNVEGRNRLEKLLQGARFSRP
jgi:voltage-gated potassium channel